MVYVLKTEAGKEVHVAPTRHPDAIDWIKCKDAEEAQDVVDYWNTCRQIGAAVSVCSALESVRYFKANLNDLSGYESLSFEMDAQGHISIKDSSKE